MNLAGKHVCCPRSLPQPPKGRQIVLKDISTNFGQSHAAPLKDRTARHGLEIPGNATRYQTRTLVATGQAARDNAHQEFRNAAPKLRDYLEVKGVPAGRIVAKATAKRNPSTAAVKPSPAAKRTHR
ncbi:hypothetical protein FQR65_LT21004 [Abscondita terminalis]|nr:hypothetical protein FQR65_LT21004 [Abscondita terminalis]